MKRINKYILITITLLALQLLQVQLLNNGGKTWKCISDKCLMSNFLELKKDNNINLLGFIDNSGKGQKGILILYANKYIIVLNTTKLQFCVYTQK